MKQRGIESYLNSSPLRGEPDTSLKTRLEMEKQVCETAEDAIKRRELEYISDPSCPLFSGEDLIIDPWQRKLIQSLQEKNRYLEAKIAEMEASPTARLVRDESLRERVHVAQNYMKNQDEFVQENNTTAIRARRIELEQELARAKEVYERCLREHETLTLERVKLKRT